MLKQTVQYTDFNGNDRKEEIYFHMSEKEVINFAGQEPEQLRAEMQTAIDTQDIRFILDFVERLAIASFGVKSADGRNFRKSDEIRDDLVSSAFWSDWLFSLFEDNGEKGIAFISGVLPANLLEAAQKQVQADKEKEREAEAERLQHADPETERSTIEKQYRSSARNVFDDSKPAE